MKIGIVPNSNNFSNPGDRRKIIRYLEIRKINFEIAEFSKRYDILYLSGSADLTVWSNYKTTNNFHKTQMIFDASDPYLSESISSNIIRSIYYFISRKAKYLKFSYAKQFKKILKEADVIICASVEQKEQIIKYNANIKIIRDYFDVDINQRLKIKNKNLNKVVNIFWEGQSHANISIFRYLKKILSNIKNYQINLNIVTDSKYCYIGGQYICYPTEEILNKIFKDTKIKINFYEWSVENLIKAASDSDVGFIPLPNKNRMQLKPENKLILMWMLGLIVLTTNTKSYARTMKEIGEDWYCANISQWHNKLTLLLESKKIRNSYIESIDKFFETKYSSKIITKEWDKIILK